ncbi:formamidase [Saccharomonospora piscinae]|uniref:Formamidase n=1 Tax=Saccharomonospora piscinae TaxID=687388 RepID=A0A1V9ACG3_SACPI|nr:formamidase [Saccharomonospora piscinae]OQO94728.1 formamidase [Saccharomonospora piscinae]TLW94569.1 acetamidase/formamidase family protein [Saccharomonospora piscinae]
MPEVKFSVDQSRRFAEQEVRGHNRWHPDVPAAVTVRPGEEFRVECREWFDGTIHNDDSADDVRDADLSIVHQLSGPIAVEGAEPGDLLLVDILDLGPVPQEHGPVAGQGWGYTGIFARDNGGGFLTDHFPDAYKAVWDFHGQTATSRHLPGVSFVGIAHPGLMGTAPSAELLSRWNGREGDLIATNPSAVPPLALPPEPHNALLGSLSGAEFDRVAAEGSRTAPPRENGGNQDIKNLSRGSRVFYPVFVPGAKLSLGDLHFSQGDGEITFCGAIEMGGYIDLHVDVIKGGMETYGVEAPVFVPGRVEPQYSEYLTFAGLSVTEAGEQRYLDATLAYRRACLHAIDYLSTFGYTREQAYLILGAAPVEGRLSGVVDIPNACATLYVPTAIFDFDPRPSAEGPERVDRGQCAVSGG